MVLPYIICMYNPWKPYSYAALINHTARLILGKFDYIILRGIELVKSLALYTIERGGGGGGGYFLAMSMFKSIHGIAPAYLCNHIIMIFDINDYDTRGTDGMNVYLPTLKKDIYKNSFFCIKEVKCGIVFQIPQIWKHLNVITKECNWRLNHDDVIKWKHFPRYWPFVRRIHRSPVNSLHKGQWCGALVFSLICVR